MTRLLHAELIKLRTTRTFFALTGCAIAASLLLVILTASLSTIDEVDLRTLFASDLSSVFIPLLAAIAVTGEWRHRTIASSVLAAPDRVRMLAAKTLAYALAGVVISLAVTASIMLAGTLIVSGRGGTTLGLSVLADVLWRNLTVAALLGALGVGVGMLLRNQIVAVTGLLIVGFVIEPMLATLVPEVAQFGPLVGAPSGILDITSGSASALSAALAPALAATASIAWASATFAAAAALLRRRDLV
jgi:ABC-2 type transport system permease protein